MANRTWLRLAAALLLGGTLITVVADILHPAGANDHVAAFTNYAASASWTAVHLTQFVGMAVILGGLLVLFFALDLTEGATRWVGVFAAVATGVTLALTGVLYAIDGVALKQAAQAWASAPPEEAAIRFASAETIRWLEWGVRSYQDLLFGAALALYAIVIVWTARVSRLFGVVFGLSGLAYIILGWLIGTQGFAPVGEVPSDAAQTLFVVAIIWLLFIALRMKAPITSPHAQPVAS
jgi:hypothetical protein